MGYWGVPGGTKGLAQSALNKIDPDDLIGKISGKPREPVMAPMAQTEPMVPPSPSPSPQAVQPQPMAPKIGVGSVNQVEEPKFSTDPGQALGSLQEKMNQTGQEVQAKHSEMAQIQEAQVSEVERMNQLRKQSEEESQLEIKDIEARAKLFNLSDDEYNRVQDIERKITMGDADERDMALHKRLNEKGQEISQWSGMGGGSKILAALSMAAGAFGSALTGGPNAAADIINKNLDDNIRRQMSRKAGFAEQVEATKEGVSREMSALDRQSADFKAAKAGQLGAVQTRIEGMIKNTQNQQAQANLVQLSSQIDQQRQGLLLDAQKAKSDERLANRRLSLQSQQFNAEQGMKQQAMEMKGVDGKKQLAASVAKELGGIEGAQKVLDTLDKDFKDPKGIGGNSRIWNRLSSILPGDYEVDNVDAKLDMAAQTIGRIMEGGKLTDADVPRYKGMLPSPFDNEELRKEKILTLRGMLATKKREEVRGLETSGYQASGLLSDRDRAQDFDKYRE